MSPVRGVQVFYSGRVQGVGFRWTVRDLAAGYEVTGWVRNLPDGRVELQAGGDPGELEQFVAAIAESHLRHHVHSANRHELDVPPPGAGFRIEH